MKQWTPECFQFYRAAIVSSKTIIQFKDFGTKILGAELGLLPCTRFTPTCTTTQRNKTLTDTDHEALRTKKANKLIKASRRFFSASFHQKGLLLVLGCACCFAWWLLQGLLSKLFRNLTFSSKHQPYKTEADQEDI